jgi:5-hydroxyisourate hydrolase-like protein (transthyretin family)
MAALQGYQGITPKASGGGGSQGAMASVQAASNNLGTLSQRLEQFTTTSLNMAAKSANFQAAQDAMDDVAKYNQKVTSIMQDNSITEADKSTRIKEIAAEHEYRGWGQTYTQAYQSKFDASFMDIVTNEAAASADVMNGLAGGDSRKFATNWSSYSKEIIESAPSPALAAAAKTTLYKQGASHFKTLATAEWKAEDTRQRKSSDDAITSISNDYITSVMDDNPDQFQIETKLKVKLQSAVANRFITQEQANIQFDIVKEDAVIGRVYDDFRNILYDKVESGVTAPEYIQSVVGNKQFKQLPKEKQEKLISAMISDVKAKNSLFDDDAKKAKAEQAKEQDDNYVEFYGQVLDKSISVAELHTAVRNGELKDSDANKLIKLVSDGTSPDNPSKMEWYYRDKKYLELTDEEIREDRSLSFKDKIELYKERDSALSKEYKWTTSQDGRQATQRIKGLFGFEEGTINASFDMDNVLSQEYNAMRTAFYDEVSMLPETEQSRNAIPIANRLISEYNNKKKDKSEKEKEAKEKRQEAIWKTKADAYNGSITGYMKSIIGEEERNAEWYRAKEKK